MNNLIQCIIWHFMIVCSLPQFSILELCESSFWIQSANKNGAAVDANQPTHAHNTRWKLVGIGETEAADETPLSFRSYRSSEGEEVTLIDGKFSSPERAIAELEIQRKQAKSIIDDKPKKDFLGNVIGQKLIIVTETGHDVTNALILWTKGPYLYEIISPSLSVALHWEKKYKY